MDLKATILPNRYSYFSLHAEIVIVELDSSMFRMDSFKIAIVSESSILKILFA